MWEGPNLSLCEERDGPSAGSDDELWSTHLADFSRLVFSASHLFSLCGLYGL